MDDRAIVALMRGRKPTPTGLRELRGNPGRRPLPVAEPKPPDATIAFDEPPAEIADDSIAAAAWRRTVPMLRQARQIRQADWMALIAVCKLWSRYLQADAEVAKLGMVVKAPTGYPIVNPYLGIANRTMALLKPLLAELGLTSSSRSRLVVDPTASWDAAGDVDSDDGTFEKLFVLPGGKP